MRRKYGHHIGALGVSSIERSTKRESFMALERKRFLVMLGHEKGLGMML